MDDDFKKLMVMVIIGYIGVVLFVCGLAYYFDSKVDESRQVCESKGGVLLDHTVQSGKATNHYYTCVKKDIIIDWK